MQPPHPKEKEPYTEQHAENGITTRKQAEASAGIE
jgi:hypothetical protein